jgi:uncharacterized protein DUF6092
MRASLASAVPSIEPRDRSAGSHRPEHDRDGGVGSSCRHCTLKGGAPLESMVLTEDEAIELLAYLVTAARTQIDEAAEYGPLRLLSAAQRLAAFVAPRVSSATRELLEGPLQQVPQTATQSRDPDGYTAALDRMCAAVAEHLVNGGVGTPRDR